MGVITKRHENVWDVLTLTAGEGNTVSPSVVLIEGHGGSMSMLIVNGATGPTVQAQVQPQISHNNVTWYDFGSPMQGGTVDDAKTSETRTIPATVKYLRFVAGSNTVQDVTVSADVTELT